MKRREKVMIGLMVASLGYGAFYYGYEYTGSQKLSNSPKCTRKLILQFVNDSTAEIEASKLDANEVYAERQIISAWSNNPFAEQIVLKIAETTKAEQLFVYTGYMHVGGRLFAIVNGVEYQAGAQLHNSQYHISSISATQVVLSINNSSKSVTVKLKE